MKISIIVYMILDLFCAAAGMGVPIFCIALGFPTGWWIARSSFAQTDGVKDVLRRTFLYCVSASFCTFIIMLAVWSLPFMTIFDPAADLSNFGEPMLLYKPLASFIAWHLLMVVVSPFLQLLTAIFAAYATILREFTVGEKSTNRVPQSSAV
jgi:hypothetical protein